MKIALIGATGMAGSRILKELLKRGHEVKAIARHTDQIASAQALTKVNLDLSDHDALVQALQGQDACISAVRFQSLDANALIHAIRDSKVKRYIVVGGAGSLIIPGQDIRVMDSPDFPESYKAEAQGAAYFLDQLKKISDLDWTYISPSAEFGPGERTGQFRIGQNELLSNENGSRISAEDFAIALVDELEQNRHIQERITVGY